MNPMKIAGFFTCVLMSFLCLAANSPETAHPYLAGAIVIAAMGFGD